MTATEIIEIKHRRTGTVLFAAEIKAGLPTPGLKLGAAVKIAIKAGANLAGANLAGAYLAGADLARAKCISDCGTPHGWRVVVVRHDDGIRIAAGCRWLTFAAAIEHWRDRPDRKLMRPLIEYIRAACKINDWPLGAGEVEG